MRTGHALDAGMRRARRTAAGARASMALAWVLVAWVSRDHVVGARLAMLGFGVIAVTALVELVLPHRRWLVIEETIAPLAAILIVGLSPEQILPRDIVWLACVACGVLARGGRQHWSGRALLLLALALPPLRHLQIGWDYGLFVLTTIMLLLSCGRSTRELRTLFERAQHEVDHDGLTGLLSRRTFRIELEALAGALARGEGGNGAALALLDVDNLGAINKRRGHAAGDAVLRRVAEQITDALGPTATVGRLGADEFAFLMPPDEAIATAVVDALAADPGVSASIGISLIPRDGEDADALLRAGDVALRVSKRTGGGRVSVYAGKSFSMSGEGGAGAALEEMIAGDGLRVAVQPIVSVATGTVHAYEALARFPGAGPLHWFALAEELGRREELEIACLRNALRLYEHRPPGTSLTVNLSGSLVADPRVRTLFDALPSAEGLILEFTENSLLQDSDALRESVERLIDHGGRFAIDDVGAGYAGLHQITVLRPDYIKLDRMLVTGVDGDPNRGALIAAMVGWASQTGGHLVAEGVETASELATLIELGVDLVQGFHLARPAPPWPGVQLPALSEPGQELPAVDAGDVARAASERDAVPHRPVLADHTA